MPRRRRSARAISNPSSVPVKTRRRAAASVAHVAEQNAVRLLRPAPHAAAQLVQLREAEAFGVLDEHDRCVRDVDPHLDHGGRHEDVDPAVAEAAA